MSSPPAPAMDAASAVAQAIGRILLAMLDAIFGDISGLSPRHPISRAHARAQRHIARYVAALAAALATPELDPRDTARPTPARASALAMPGRRDLRAPPSSHRRMSPATLGIPPRAPPPRENRVWSGPHNRA